MKTYLDNKAFLVQELVNLLQKHFDFYEILSGAAWTVRKDNFAVLQELFVRSLSGSFQDVSDTLPKSPKESETKATTGLERFDSLWFPQEVLHFWSPASFKRCLILQFSFFVVRTKTKQNNKTKKKNSRKREHKFSCHALFQSGSKIAQLLIKKPQFPPFFSNPFGFLPQLSNIKCIDLATLWIL